MGESAEFSQDKRKKVAKTGKKIYAYNNLTPRKLQESFARPAAEELWRIPINGCRRGKAKAESLRQKDRAEPSARLVCLSDH